MNVSLPIAQGFIVPWPQPQPPHGTRPVQPHPRAPGGQDSAHSFLQLEDNVERELLLLMDGSVKFSGKFVGGQWHELANGDLEIQYHHSGDRALEKKAVYRRVEGTLVWKREVQIGWRYTTYLIERFSRGEDLFARWGAMSSDR
jgi:hypothetical protein